MTKRMKFAVLGAGGGGQVMAAHLSMQGFEVRLYDLPEFKHVIQPINEQGGIYLTGVLGRYFARIKSATVDMKEAVEGADLINVVVPAFAHPQFCRALAPILKDGQIVVFHPGYLGALLLAKTMKEMNPKTKVLIGEAQTMLYNARNKEPAHAWAFGIKAQVQLAAFPGRHTQEVVQAVNTAFPQFIPARDIFESFLNNISLVFHPAPTLLNAGRIESTKGAFRYYWDGATDSVARFMEALDEERIRIVKELGLNPIYCKQWLKNMYSEYGAEGNTLREVLLNCRNYETGATPSSLKFTYLSQDVPYGLVPMVSLAEQLHIDTPRSATTIQMASFLNETDYVKQGYSMESLGLQGMNAKDLAEFLREGRKA